MHFNSRVHAEARGEIRNKAQAEKKEVVGEDGEMTENRGETRDEQTERGMWRQRYGWIKRGKEFQGEIETEEGGGGGEHMDLITSR